MLSEIGRLLIFFGAIIVILGLILTFLPSLKVGRLPGDIVVRRENWSLFIPITTSILLSVVLTLLFWFLSSFRK